MSQRLFMPRKPLDIKLTDYPLDKERSSQLLSLPSRRGTGVGRAHKTKSSPSKKAGANVSVILGHFQKCLTLLIASENCAENNAQLLCSAVVTI